jgi:3'-phosphoadenosine 5'-phosphosulfate sulfotransferase (PAPS reductase)/FAD synthetase
MNSKQPKHILSYGAGLNSTALMIYLIENNLPLDEVVFADTGGETPETYQHLKVTSEYLHKNGVPLTILRSNRGSLYETCVRRKVIPSQVWRWCTRDYKITPIHRHYRQYDVPIIQYLGIAYEERDRAKPNKVADITNKFPLIENKVDRQGCLDLICLSNFDFPAPPRSGCYFCPFNSLSRWREVYSKHEDLFVNARLLEEGSKHFPKQKLTRLTLKELQESFESQKSLQDFTVRKVCASECII